MCHYSSQRVIETLGYEHEITFFFRFMIHYAIDNEEEAEGIYREEGVKYEKAILLGQIVAVKKRRKKQDFTIAFISIR